MGYIFEIHCDQCHYEFKYYEGSGWLFTDYQLRVKDFQFNQYRSLLGSQSRFERVRALIDEKGGQISQAEVAMQNWSAWLR